MFFGLNFLLSALEILSFPLPTNCRPVRWRLAILYLQGSRTNDLVGGVKNHFLSMVFATEVWQK